MTRRNTAQVRTDPRITSTDGRASPGEIEEWHDVLGDAGADGVTIGVQDTGLDASHPFVAERTAGVAEFRDYTGAGEGDGYGHGTLVADLATRYAAGAELVVHRIFGGSGSGADGIAASFDRAIELAERGELDVLNMSWGYPEAQVDWVDEKVNELAEAGCVPVSAAGNTAGATGSPATAEKCVSVGALEEGAGRMTNFSSWDQDGGPNRGLGGVPDVCAVGRNVVGARAGGTSMGRPIDGATTKASGTSFSSPIVAGLVADLLRREPGLGVQGVVRALEGSADDIEGTHRDGLGSVDWDGAASWSDGEAHASVWTPPWSEKNFFYVGAEVVPTGSHTVDLEALRGAFDGA